MRLVMTDRSIEARRAGVTRFSAIAASLLLAVACTPNVPSSNERAEVGVCAAPTLRSPTLADAIGSQTDLWTQAVIHDHGEPDYASFAGLLPPLRYVDAVFRHYPIVLSPPAGPIKARLVSNGSAINAKAMLRTWKELGYPVTFHVEDGAESFGEDLRRLDGPRYVDGFLPIVRMRYRCGSNLYEQECFAATEDDPASRGAVLVRFTLLEGNAGRVDAHIRVWGPITYHADRVVDEQQRVYLQLDDCWRVIDRPQRRHSVTLQKGESAHLLILSQPSLATTRYTLLTSAEYERRREACRNCWEALLKQGVDLRVPEDVVNKAWRSLIVGTFICAQGDVLNYSAGNAYERQYVAECGDAILALLMYGFTPQARAMIPPLLDHAETIPGKRVKYHNAGFGLQLVARYYWLTRDAAFVQQQRDRWSPLAQLIMQHREPGTGLLPPENYAGDIFDQVYSLNTNSNCWRGLRDMAAVLADMGLTEEGQPLAEAATALRQAILQAVARSERLDVKPPFVPNALLASEAPHESITNSVMGSYWNLMMPYVLGSGVLGPESPRTRWVLDYIHRRGGVCMGLTRFDMHADESASSQGLDDLYGLRYVLTLLEQDDVERALASFYGKLTQGLTRDTFIGAECTSLVPLDEFGRPMGLPPNSASNAFFLWMLRYLLVQDWDADDDGAPETLRLLCATPRDWLADGRRIMIRNAPTAFGPVSLDVQSQLSAGKVIIRITAPRDAPQRTLLRVRLPDGFRVAGAMIADAQVPVEPGESLDLSDRHGDYTVTLLTTRRLPASPDH